MDKDPRIGGALKGTWCVGITQHWLKRVIMQALIHLRFWWQWEIWDASVPTWQPTGNQPPASEGRSHYTGPQLSMQTVTRNVLHLANYTQTCVKQEKIKSDRNKPMMSSDRGVQKIHIDLKVNMIERTRKFLKIKTIQPNCT